MFSLFFFSREEKTRSNTKILVGPFLEEEEEDKEEEDKEEEDKEEEKAFTSVIIIIIIIALLLLLLLRVVRGSAPKVHGVKVFYNHRKKFRTLNTTTTARARFR